MSLKLWKWTRLALITTSALALSAKAVFAMPVAIGLLGSLATSIAAGASATQLVTGLFVAALSYAANTLLAQMMAPDVKAKGIKQKLESGGDNPLSFILGEYCTAGKLVYVNQVDIFGTTPNNRLVLVISLSELPVAGFDSIVIINGERCTIDFSMASPLDPADDGDTFADYSPRPGYYRIVEYDKRDDDLKTQYCWMRFYDGTQTTADKWMLDTFGSDPDKPWTADMVGRGCAYAIVCCTYSDAGVWSGVPEFKFILRGKKLYDWRKDSTNGGSGSHRWGTESTYEYSANPVVMKYNIIRGLYYGSDWVWGGQNLDGYRLPVSYWTAAANHCDETVALAAGGSVPRYAAGCEIHVDQQPIDVMKDLDKACAGYTSEFGGQWKTWSGPPGSSVLSITDADIIITEEQTDNLFRPSQEIFNGAHGTYTNGRLWVSKEAPVRTFPALVDEDYGYQLIADVQLPYVTEQNQVGRLLRLAVLDSRRQITHVMSLPPEAYMLEPFDVVSWTSDRNGYVNKKFRVESIDDQGNVNQVVSLREVDTSDYDWDTSMELPETIGTVTQVRPGTLSLDFTVTADQLDNDSGGKDKPAINIAWTWGNPDIGVGYVKYEIRRHGTTKVIASGTFHNTDEGDRTITHAAFRFGKQYDVRLAAVPAQRGRAYDWTAWKSVTLFNIDIPTAPTLTRVSDLANDGTLNFFLDIDWTAVAGSASYVVRVAITGGSTRTYRVQDNNYRITVTSGMTYTVDVRAVAEGDGGSVGDWSPASLPTTVTKKNTAPTTPAGLAATAGFKQVSLSWTKSPDNDYKETVIYRATTNDFSLAVEVGRKTGTRTVDGGLTNGVTYYYWITHVDRSGNESAKYPSSSTAGVAITPAKVVDGDTDSTPLSAPAGLTLTQDNADLNGDGTVDIAVLASWTDLGSAAKEYEVEFSQSATSGGTYTVIDNKFAKQNEVRFPAKTTKFYKARIRALNAFGNPGTWSSLTSAFQPSKKSATPGAPTGVSVTPKGKGLRISWSQAADTDIKRYELYVNTTNSSTSGGTLVKAGNGDDFLYAAELTVGQAYYCFLRSVDRSDNVSAWISASNNPQVYRRVASSDMSILDMHANAENTDLSLGPNIGWTDSATIINDPTNAFQGNYVIKRAYTGSASSWVNRNNMMFPVRAGEQYYFGGMVKKDGSFASTNIGWRLSWRDDTNTEIADTTPAATTSITTSWQEIGALATVPAGAAYACLEFAIYNQTAGTGFGSHGYARPAVIDGMTDQTALAAPSCLDSSSATVTSAVYMVQDDQDVDGDGKVDTAIVCQWIAVAGAKRYDVEVSRYDAGSSTWKVTGLGGHAVAGVESYTFKANTSRKYKVRVRARNFAGVPGSWTTNVVVLTTSTAFSSYTGFQPAPKAAAPGDPSGIVVGTGGLYYSIAITTPTYADYAYSEFVTTTTTAAPSIGATPLGTFIDRTPQLYYPSVSPSFYVWVRNVNNSGQKSNWVAYGSPTAIAPQTLDGGKLSNETVDTLQIADNAVSVGNEVSNDASISIASSTLVTVLTASSVNLVNVREIWFFAEFVNDSGSDQNYNIRLFRTNSSGTALKEWLTIKVPNGAHWSGSFMYTVPSPTGSDDFLLVLSAGSSTSAKYRKLGYIKLKK